MEPIGRYLVIRELGQGGMGHVFLAHDPTLERDVALKLLHREGAQSTLRDEAKALAALSHPGIVTIYEIGEHHGQDFIAMEYLRGSSLRDVLKERASRHALLAICAKVATAVAAAHRAGILHRDIKPENVVVTTAGDVKVVDFGLARRLNHPIPRFTRAITAHEIVDVLTTIPLGAPTDTVVNAATHTVFGTPAYMAPEVLMGETSTEASDVYSLGVVIHECIVGRRPHDATTLVEVIAQAIQGEFPRLMDPLGELVERMLARDPTRRPPLEVVAALVTRAFDAPPTAAPLARPRRWPVIVAGVAAGALGVVGWQLAHRTPAVSAPVTATIAIAPIVTTMPTYGREPPVPTAIADSLAKLVGQVEGARLTAIPATTGDPSAARALGADYLVTGTIREQGSQLHAHVDLVAIATGAPLAVIDLTRPSPRIAQLIDAIAVELAHRIAPAATLDLRPSRPRAQLFYREGQHMLEEGRFTDARMYLEQAVDTDPSFADGWYALALALGWTDAAEALEHEATEQALSLVATGPRRQLMQGVSLFLEQRWTEMRAVLEPLDQPGPDRREILYYLGEANWHDGRHDAAFGYFKRALDLDVHFRPATVHAWQYEVARRDVEGARYYVGLADENTGWIDMARGDYAQLAHSDNVYFKLAARLVLGLPVAPDADDLDGWTYRIALAIGAGDAAAAKRMFAEAWSRWIANRDPRELDSGIYYGLEQLGEVVISAGFVDETRLLVGFLAQQSKPHATRGYQRLSILAAPIVGDKSLLVSDQLSERSAQLFAASQAELAGDRAKAAAILGRLVANPTFQWDYPERAALLRNLRALHDDKHSAALCADTLRPAIVHAAFSVLRRACT